MNICFSYLYRDAGNSKNWGEVIFSNMDNIEVGVLEREIRKVIIEEMYFVARKVDIPEVMFEKHIASLDHDWHEFNSLANTIEGSDDIDIRDIKDFVESLTGMKNYAYCID